MHLVEPSALLAAIGPYALADATANALLKPHKSPFVAAHRIPESGRPFMIAEDGSYVH